MIDTDFPDSKTQTKTLSSPTVEASVLSILLAFPDAFDDHAPRLKPAHFSDALHRSIFSELVRQMALGKGCDLVTLSEGLRDTVSLQRLHEIASCHDFSSRTVGNMVDTLIDRFQSRQLHRLSQKMSTLAFGDGPAQERIAQAHAAITAMDSSTDDADEWVDAHAAAIAHLDLIDARQAGKIKGLETGLPDFDDLLDGGMQRGNLIVIGARPSMGKTALGMTIGLHMAQTYCVGLLSMEMPHNDVRDRQAAILSSASISSIKRPSNGLDYERIVDGVNRSKRLRFFVSDKSGQNIAQVRSKARMLHRKHAMDVLILDYIGLMPGTDPKQQRTYQIEEITHGLKALAKDLDIVVLGLAQVNRGSAERIDAVPGLHDLRDSGAIEQDADVVAFVHRPIQLKPDLGEQWANYALLRVAKNRQGRCGDVHLHYQGHYTRFSSWAGEVPSKTVSKTQPAKRGFDDDCF